MKVLHTIQSPGSEPVTYAYTNGTDAIGAVAAVANILKDGYQDIPEGFRPITVSITVEF